MEELTLRNVIEEIDKHQSQFSKEFCDENGDYENKRCVIGSEEPQILNEQLNLSHKELWVPIIFKNIYFTQHVNFAYARLKSCHFLDCRVASFDGIGMTVSDDFAFCATPTKEESKQDLDEEKNPSDTSSRSHKTKLEMAPVSASYGTFRLANANIGKRLILSGSHFQEGCKSEALEAFTNSSEVAPRGAIDAGHLFVGSTVWIDFVRRQGNIIRFRSYGAVSLRGSTINGKIFCQKAEFIAGRHSSYISDFLPKIGNKHFDRLPNGQKFFRSDLLMQFIFGLSDSVTISDETKVKDALDELSSSETHKISKNYQRSALSLDCYGATVQGSVEFIKSRFEGTVRLGSSKLKGKLVFSGSRLAEISPRFLINEKFKGSPIQRLAQTTIKAYNWYGSTAYKSRGALDAYKATIDGSVYIISSKRSFVQTSETAQKERFGYFYSIGRVSFSSATIGGRFSVTGACIFRTANFLDQRAKPMASLELSGIEIAKNLYIGGGSLLCGTTSINRARVRGSCLITTSTFVATGTCEHAIYAEELNVGSLFEILNKTAISGRVSFREARFESSMIIRDSICIAPSNTNEFAYLDALKPDRSGTTSNYSVFRSFSEKKIFKPALEKIQSNKTAGILSYQKVLVDLHSSTVHGSLRFSSSDESDDYTVIFGKLRLEKASIEGELDLCASCLSKFTGAGFYKIGAYSFRESANGAKIYPTSLPKIDLRYAKTETLRMNSHIPEVGCMLVNGFEFKSISGELLTSTETIKKLIQVSGFFTDQNNKQVMKMKASELRSAKLTWKMHKNFSTQLIDRYAKQSDAGSFFKIIDVSERLKGIKIVEPEYFTGWFQQIKNQINLPYIFRGTFLILTAISLAAFTIGLTVFLYAPKIFENPKWWLPHPYFSFLFFAISGILLGVSVKHVTANRASLKNFGSLCENSNTDIGSHAFLTINTDSIIRQLFDLTTYFGYKPQRILYFVVAICLISSAFFTSLSQSKGILVDSGGIYIVSESDDLSYIREQSFETFMHNTREILFLTIPLISVPSQAEEPRILQNVVKENKDEKNRESHVPAAALFVADGLLMFLRILGWLGLTFIATGLRNLVRRSV